MFLMQLYIRLKRFVFQPIELVFYLSKGFSELLYLKVVLG